jgi:hypothetical protein
LTVAQIVHEAIFCFLLRNVKGVVEGTVRRLDSQVAVENYEGLAKGCNNVVGVRKCLSQRPFCLSPFANVSKDKHHARDLPLVIGDRGSTITYRSFRTVSGDEDAMARQFKHVVFAQALDGGNLDRLPALFVNDANHAIEWLPHGLLGPSRQRLSDRVQKSDPAFAVSANDRIANT